MSNIRADAGEMPYADRSVTFIRILSATEIDACNDRATKRAWLAEDVPLFAGWTGRYRTDIFLLNRPLARKALS
jgi:hypothetical protein